jgi:glucose-6-phosphate dehydrogenase assembly protein OpcA
MAVADEIERSDAVVITANRLPIDDAGPRAQACQRLDDQREAIGEVIAGTAVELHLCGILAGDDPKAVVLDLVQPFAA